ncbi:hypothetical protein BKA93DRAFT_796236 [Sparassis latifolia]
MRRVYLKLLAISISSLYRAHSSLSICRPANSSKLLYIHFQWAILSGTVFASSSVLIRDHHLTGAYLLADILEKAHELRSIYMEDTEHLIYAAPRIGNALTELERLEDIHLYGVSNLVREILPTSAARRTKSLSQAPIVLGVLNRCFISLSSLCNVRILSMSNGLQL